MADWGSVGGPAHDLNDYRLESHRAPVGAACHAAQTTVPIRVEAHHRRSSMDLVFTILAVIVAGITAFSAYFLFNGIPDLSAPVNDRSRRQGRRS